MTTGEIESRKRPPRGDEHSRPEKRRRGDDPVLPQATICGGEPGFTRPSQQTPAANSGSAQVVVASAHAGNTSLNAREEITNDRLQHSQDTPSMCGVPTSARFPAPDPVASGQQIEYMPNLHPQWQSDPDFVRRQETAAQTACFRPSPIANDPMRANLTKAGEALVQQGVTNYPGSYDQSYFPANQDCGAVGAGAPAWNDNTYDVRSEEFDPAFWNTIFP